MKIIQHTKIYLKLIVKTLYFLINNHANYKKLLKFILNLN